MNERTRNDPPDGAAQPLDYPSPPPSPYDRPVEQTLRFVGQLHVVVGVLVAVGVLVGGAFVVWVLIKLW
jgi:hypothetical protein